jgi:hypothetical protein
MSHILQVCLEGFVSGFFVIQPAFNVAEFAKLIERKLPEDFVTPYVEVYRDLKESRSGSLFCDAKSPWVIVVFGSSPKLLRRYALHEIVHLAREIMPPDGRQFIFIERAYTAIKIPREDSHGFSAD